MADLLGKVESACGHGICHHTHAQIGHKRGVKRQLAYLRTSRNLARSHANATQPAPYSPGGTTLITGDKVATGSVNADRMNTASFAATGLALFGGAVRSTNFVSGTRGWRIDNNGSMELQNLVARDWVQVGAVSEGVTYTNGSSRAVSDGQAVTTLQALGAFELGPILANRSARPVARPAKIQEPGHGMDP